MALSGNNYVLTGLVIYVGGYKIWTISTEPNAKLVNTMFYKALETLGINEHPIIHSDCGAHYRWPGWIERIKTYSLTQSISKKGRSPDNSACEGFFETLEE